MPFGVLLALMAVPTMFSLSEDALNNVPRAYIDASDALGATKLQTVFLVIVPAAISGMAAAVLLGLGRVIGETMVVLLVAGCSLAGCEGCELQAARGQGWACAAHRSKTSTVSL